ncbi:MAG TPA: hypothetical protein PKJ77_03085 [Thermodesulfobacteriota bacterium]|nr:hypothetical protein [Deltaproteobacteria bacterium]HOC38242.1 hypothetical protein [Thermodesulfobacteriota bacterium]
MKSTFVRIGIASMVIALLVITSFADVFAEGRTRARRSTVTRPNGTTATRDTSGVWDPETKTWKKNATTAGAQGRQISRDSEVVKTDEGYVRNSTITGPSGETVTRSATGTYDPETKTMHKGATVTGADGKSVSTYSEATKTDTGTVRNSVSTGPNGETMTRSAAGTWDPETKTLYKGTTVTGPDGKAVTTYSEGTKTEDGYARKSMATGPDGQTSTRSAAGTWDPTTRTWTKDAVTTAPDGTTVTQQKQIQGTTTSPEASVPAQ